MNNWDIYECYRETISDEYCAVPAKVVPGEVKGLHGVVPDKRLADHLAARLPQLVVSQRQVLQVQRVLAAEKGINDILTTLNGVSNNLLFKL